MSSSAEYPITLCLKCKGANPRGKKFCGDCGASLDPLTGTVNSYLDANLKARIDEVIKDRFKDQKVTEAEIAADIAEKLTGWAKLFSVFVALPMALILAILGFYGLRELSDVRKAKDEVDSKIKESRQAIDDSVLKSKDNLALAQTIRERLETDKKTAEKTETQVAELQRKVQERSAQLDQIPQLTKKVNVLEATVKNFGNPASPMIIKNLQKEGKAIGIDASRFNGDIDWNKLKGAGVSFAFIRATQGTSATDPKFADNWSRSKKAGILRGAYHFFVYNVDPQEQAEHFTKMFREESGDLPPVADVEQNPVGFTPSSADEVKRALDNLRIFIETVRKNTGCNPIIATSGHYWEKTFSPSASDSFSNHPLWIMRYSQNAQAIPPWKKWTFWQFDDQLGIKDLPQYDFSAYDGSDQQLKEFAKQQCTHQ
jgi:GH25 family lysozyme M1 (1,4-beta-N-acetylmuramidase)